MLTSLTSSSLRLLLLVVVHVLVVVVEGRNEEGEWGVPQNTFTIPISNPSQGLHLIDIQNSFPQVNWATLDRLYIPGGQYKFIKIGNLPDRAPEQPLIITNINGQVRVGGLDHYYLFNLYGGSNWVLTGKYDPVSLTGDVNYPGHLGNNYESTQGTYGFLIDDDFRTFGTGNSGLAIGDRNVPTTDFEVSFFEIREVGFAGMTIKSDDLATATMTNVFLHDNYIHDMGSEGIYLGSTQSHIAQHSFEKLTISNNRILRTGTEGLQVGQLGDGCEIHNNVVALSAIDWKDAFQSYQDNSGQVSFRYGQASVHHNIFIGAGDSLLNFQALNAAGDVHMAGDSIDIHDNFFSSSRFLGVHMGQHNQPQTSPSTPDGVTLYKITNNKFRQLEFQRNEVYGSWPPPNEEVIRVNQYLTNEIRLDGNSLNKPGLDHLYLSKFPYQMKLDLNGQSGNIIATNNIREIVDPVTFQNFFPDVPGDVDYLLFERWAGVSGLTGESINYNLGDYVMYRGNLYLANEANTGIQPDLDTAGVWTLLSPPVDDVRLACDSAHVGVGLLDTVDDCSTSCMGKSYCVKFKEVSSTFGGTGEDISLTYDASQVIDATNSYQTTILKSDCQPFTIATPTPAVSVVSNSYAYSGTVTPSTMTVSLDVDTSTVEGQAELTTFDPNDSNKFSVSFCAKTDLMYSDAALSATPIEVASSKTIITLTVDKNKGFDFALVTASIEASGFQSADVSVDYPLTQCVCDASTKTCVDSSGGAPLLPGDSFTYCVSTGTSTEAKVVGLKDVAFYNGHALTNGGLTIPILNSGGSPVGPAGAFDCAAPSNGCHATAVAFAKLYEAPDANGVLQPIFEDIKVRGTAILQFIVRRQLEEGNVVDEKELREVDLASVRYLQPQQEEDEGTPVNSFELGLNLASPPVRSTATGGSSTLTIDVSLMVVGTLVGLIML